VDNLGQYQLRIGLHYPMILVPTRAGLRCGGPERVVHLAALHSKSSYDPSPHHTREHPSPFNDTVDCKSGLREEWETLLPADARNCWSTSLEQVQIANRKRRLLDVEVARSEVAPCSK
jgi:hypothetical protein